MMHSIRKLLLGVGAAALVAVSAVPALASPSFPAALQEAAEMPCAPSCVICHGVDPGTASTFGQRPLGLAMFSNGATSPDENKLKDAWAKFAADPANAAVVADVQAGIDPQSKADLCQLKYGCGARIAKETPRDDWSGLLFVAGAMGFGALLRRTKRR